MGGLHFSQAFERVVEKVSSQQYVEKTADKLIGESLTLLLIVSDIHEAGKGTTCEEEDIFDFVI